MTAWSSRTRGFPPLVDLLESVGVQLVGVPVDDEGLDLAALEAALAEPVAAVFLQPRAQNPVGVTMTTTRAQAIADLLDGSETLVVEDDSAAGCPPPPSPASATGARAHGIHPLVLEVTRTGPASGRAQCSAGAAPRDHGRRELGQGWSSRLLQQVLLGLLTGERPAAQVAHASATYAARRAAVVDALALRGVVVRGTEGINIWVPVRDETAAVVRLASQGIGVAPGAPFRLGRPKAADTSG